MEYSVLYLCNSLENFILTQSLKAVYWKIHGSEASKRKKNLSNMKEKMRRKKYIYIVYGSSCIEGYVICSHVSILQQDIFQLRTNFH